MVTLTPIVTLRLADLDSIAQNALDVIRRHSMDNYHFSACLYEFGRDVGSGLIHVSITFRPYETIDARLSFVARDYGNGDWKLSPDHSVTFDVPKCFDRAYHFWPWANDWWMNKETPPAVVGRIRDMLSA